MNKFVLIAGLFFAGQAFAAWSGEYADTLQPQKVDGYYQITNENELAWISATFAGNTKNENVKFMADLDMGGKAFVPICAGKGTPKFQGVFDGNGQTIKNLYIDSDSSKVKLRKNGDFGQNQGFIAVIGNEKKNDFTLKNITFKDAVINGDVELSC